MKTMTHRRPLALPALALVALAVALAGCTAATTDAVPPTKAVGPSTVADSPAPSVTVNGQPRPGPYPTDYHGAVMAAWSNHDTARLALLTADPNDFLAIAGNPDQHWTLIHCEGAMGSGYCSYSNRDGDAITIRVDHQTQDQHQWHAAILWGWDPISFPAYPKAYADMFLHAWIDGNHTRMLLLSNQRVVDQFTALGLVDYSYTIATEGAAGHTYAQITNTDGFNQTISLLNDQVTRQLPHAIDGVN